jgi:hypothetical protein
VSGVTRHRRKTGPERFWDHRRVRVTLAFAFVVSLAGHYAIGPWTLFPTGLEVRDVEGDTTIPIDVLDPGKPVAEVEQPPEAPPPVHEGEGATRGVHTGNDAGIDPPKDAAPDAPPDAVADALADALADAADASDPDANDAAPVDAGGPDAAPHDPVAMVGDVGKVQADEALVVLLVNAQEIRKHPVGAQMGGLLSSIPQWDDFIAGTGVDPIQQADWLLISGPGLVNTANDVILVRYNAPDAVVDHAIDVISKKSSNGSAFDAGVPGMRAALGTADRAPRVFLRPQHGLLAVVPPFYAAKAAAMLAKVRVSPRVRPGEAMRLTLKKPYQPFPDIPKTVSEVRLWVVPMANGGAEMFAEGDCASASDATDAAAHVNTVFDRFRHNALVSLVTHGLLKSLDIHADETHIELHLTATEEQLDALLTLVGGEIHSMKAQPPPPPAGSR